MRRWTSQSVSLMLKAQLGQSTINCSPVKCVSKAGRGVSAFWHKFLESFSGFCFPFLFSEPFWKFTPFCRISTVLPLLYAGSPSPCLRFLWSCLATTYYSSFWVRPSKVPWKKHSTFELFTKRNSGCFQVTFCRDVKWACFSRPSF